MTLPPLSVALSVYNGARFLDLAIASIRAQSFGDFEFLIHDDGSTDGSFDIMARHAAQDPRIRLSRESNKGLVESLNRLVDQARAPLIARMDGDDIAHPQRFARQIAFLLAQDEIAVLGTQAEIIDAQSRILPDPNPHPLTHEEITAGFGHQPHFVHSSVMFRRAAFLSVGRYRSVARHCEDLDLWLRLSRTTRLANLPDYLMQYRVYPEQVSRRHLLEQARNAAITIFAHQMVLAGQEDPLRHHDVMPDLDDVACAFNAPDLPARVRAQIIRQNAYAPEMLAGAGLSVLRQHLAEAPKVDIKQIIRIIARLARNGYPRAAIQITTDLGARVARG